MNTTRPVYGVVLAGGLGTRMKTLTSYTNKHLLPVYDRPMVCWPINTLLENDIEQFIIVSGDSRGAIQGFLGSGQLYPKECMPEGKKPPRFTHKTQDNPTGGIGDALDQAADVILPRDAIVVVILGDNIFPCNMGHVVRRFVEEQDGRGARIHLCRVPDPERFGVAHIVDGKIINIIEKPKNGETDSNFAVTGLYMYDIRVFEFIKRLVPSKRKEKEITDVNNIYRQMGELSYEVVESWTDAGEVPSRIRADVMCGAYLTGRTVPEYVKHLQLDPIKRTNE